MRVNAGKSESERAQSPHFVAPDSEKKDITEPTTSVIDKLITINRHGLLLDHYYLMVSQSSSWAISNSIKQAKTY